MSDFHAKILADILRLRSQLNELAEVNRSQFKQLTSEIELLQKTQYHRLLTLNHELKLLSSAVYQQIEKPNVLIPSDRVSSDDISS